MSVPTRSLRNIAFAGHGGTGKTTLVEEILVAGGVIPKAEKVETGKTVSDFTEEEIARKISIHASMTHVSWKDVKINMLDTPGSADFVGEVYAAFRVADCAALLVGADVGVQIETIKLWRRLVALSMPRFVIVNKMEKERADFSRSVADLAEKFKAGFVPVIIPIGAGADFNGVIDLVDQKAYIGGKEAPIPDDLKGEAESARQKLVESAAEGDDTLIEKFFADGTLTPEEIRRGLAGGIRNGKIVPGGLHGGSCRRRGFQPPGFHHLRGPVPGREQRKAQPPTARSSREKYRIPSLSPVSCTRLPWTSSPARSPISR